MLMYTYVYVMDMYTLKILSILMMIYFTKKWDPIVTTVSYLLY